MVFFAVLRFGLFTGHGCMSQVVGITHKDISLTKGDIPDWGIFGCGFAPGRVCVVSTFRLKWVRTTRELFLQRLERVAVHELAHTFGLQHYPSPAEEKEAFDSMQRYRQDAERLRAKLQAMVETLHRDCPEILAA